MFENILGQEPITTRLSSEVHDRTLPPTLLFCGPDYAGKASTTLELARVLTCTGPDRSVPWRCTCTSCVQQRHLLHPETLLLGGRYFLREIHVAARALKRDQRGPLRYLLARSIRKLTRRFDPVLWEGDTKSIAKVEPLLSQIDELLDPYLPGAELPPETTFADGLDKLLAAAAKLESAVNLASIPVDVIRRLNRWARVSASGPAKIAMIENVDRLGDSSRNALLKTLEEPPSNLFFVLTTTRRGAVISTILSRARNYSFSGRGEEESAAVIRRIFRDEPSGGSRLREYFAGQDATPLRPLAERFLDQIGTGRALDLSLVDEITAAVSTHGRVEGFRAFLEVLAELLRGRVGTDVTPRSTIELWHLHMGKARERVESFNMPPGRVIEGLFYSLEAG